MKPWLLLFILINTLLLPRAHGEIEEAIPELKDFLWVELKTFSFFSAQINDRLQKDTLLILSKQQDYELVFAGSKQISEIDQTKRSIKIMRLDFKLGPDELYSIEASVRNLKDNKIIRRIRKRDVPADQLVTFASKAVHLLFFPPDPKPRKVRAIPPALPPSERSVVEPPTRDQIDFQKVVNSLKVDVKDKFEQIELEKKEVAEKPVSKDTTPKRAPTPPEKQKAESLGNVAPPAPEDPIQSLPAHFVPRNAFFMQVGFLSQNYEILENAATEREFEVRTNLQFLSAKVETMRQLLPNTELDWLALLKVGYPLSKATVPVNKYLNMSLGLNYVFFRQSVFPVGFSLIATKDNLSFANVPSAGGGLKTSDISMMWFGPRITVGTWEKRISLQFSFQNSFSASPEENTFNNDSLEATRLESQVTFDTNFLLKNTTSAVSLAQTSITSEGTRPLEGSDTSLTFYIGYIF